MTISSSERRQIENEMIFRRANEKVAQDLAALDASHIEDGHTSLTQDDDLTLEFKCECSDEECTDRIPMLVTDYEAIHLDRSTFIVLPNHQVDVIEEIVSIEPAYTVVRKNNVTAEPTGSLNTTPIHNT